MQSVAWQTKKKMRLMDDESWAIRHLVVETGHLFSHRKIAISAQHVDHISYEEHAVFVNMTKKAILGYHVPLGATQHNPQNLD